MAWRWAILTHVAMQLLSGADSESLRVTDIFLFALLAVSLPPLGPKKRERTQLQQDKD